MFRPLVEGVDSIWNIVPNIHSTSVYLQASRILGGKKAFDEGVPFGVEGGTTKFPGALIPIFGVGGLF
jgi:hypothetical protein